MDGDESKDNQLDEFIPIEDLQPKEEFNPESTTSSIENLGKFTSPKESDPKPEPEPESQSTSPRDNFWGYFTILVAVVLIIALGATWYKFYYIGQQGPPVIEGSAYSLNPAEHLDDWTLALEFRNLAEIPLEKKKGFL